MIGDVLASTIICEAIKMEHPNAEIHYLIQKNTFPVVENNPFIDKIVFFEEKNYIKQRAYIYLKRFKGIQAVKFGKF